VRLSLTALATALTMLLALTGTAFGARVSADTQTSSPPSGVVTSQSLTFTAAAGETNHVVLDFSPDQAHVTVTDSGASLEAGAHCTLLDAHSARCDKVPEANVIDTATATLGDGNDDIRVGTGRNIPIVTVDGGPGDDHLAGGDRNNHFNGGGGRDEMIGGSGFNTFDDGDREGAAGPDGPGPDVFDGSAGEQDVVTYASRTAPMNIDAGSAVGEGDSLRGIETIVGGSGSDRLVGDSGANTLDGGPGDDTLVGGGSPRGKGDVLKGGDGDDRLDGGAGPDTLDGGAGADRLNAGGGADILTGGPGLDAISCGRGNDQVDGPEVGELLTSACERGQTAFDEDLSRYLDWRPHQVGARVRSISFLLGCPFDLEQQDTDRYLACHATIALRAPGGSHRLLGRGAFTARPVTSDGESQPPRARRIAVKLTHAGSRLAHRRGGGAADVSLRYRGYPLVAWTTRINAPRR
jgi:hypothetical protein